MPEPVLPKRVPLKGKAVATMGPKRTYGKNSTGRGFAIDANITAPVEAQYSGILPRMFDGNALDIPATTKATVAADNAMKWSTQPSLGTGTTPVKRIPGTSYKDTINRIGKFTNELSPYISNISNAFRKAPRPVVPVLDSYTNLSKVNFSDERNAIRRTTNAAAKATERNVDANTAEAVKAYYRGQEFNQISSVNERESNTNVGIANQQAMMDAQVKAGNTERWNDYNDARTAAAIADTRERSANVANAGDKFTLIGNEKRKAKLDLDKTRVLSSVFSKSGVLSRQAREWKKMGVDDPLGMDYSYAESDEDNNKRKNVKANGGMIKRSPRKLQL